MDKRENLLVTGVTGYLGAHIAKQALETGKYNVFGSVRNPKDEKKKEMMREGFGKLFDELILVRLDFEDPESAKEAIKDMVYVISCASPIDLDGINGPTAVKEAVDGGRAIINACIQSGTVRRLIQTSSTCCILDYSKEDGFKCDETTFCPVDGVVCEYTKSKILQEQEIKSIYEKLSDEEKTFDIVYLLPGAIIGPPLLKNQGSNPKLYADLIQGNGPSGFPRFYFGFCDVRETARMHIEAITKGKPNERYALANYEPTCHPDMAKILEEKYGKYGYKVVTKDIGCLPLWFFSWFNRDANYFYETMDKRIYISNDKIKKDLGYKEIPYEEMLDDMVQALIEKEYIEDKITGYKEEKK